MFLEPTVQRADHFALHLGIGRNAPALQHEQPGAGEGPFHQETVVAVLVKPVGLAHAPTGAVAVHRAGEVPLGHGEGHLGGYGGIELHEQAGEPERRYVHRAPFSDEPLNTRTATKAFLLGEGMTLHAGVVGPEGRFHDVENLLCADSSVFVTSTGYGPTLTLAALAHRTASLLAGTPVPR